jgi:hypothetical protein
MEKPMRYVVKDHIDAAGNIVIEEGWESPMETLQRSIIYLKDQRVRQRLIELGWTPPKDEKND